MSRQFPSLHGDPDGEVAQRSPDGGVGDVFRRVFTVPDRSHTPGLPIDHESHLSRLTETVADAVRRGLHPKGDPEFDGETPHPTAPNNTNLTYSVHVVPAAVDNDPTTTATPATVTGAVGYVS